MLQVHHLTLAAGGVVKLDAKACEYNNNNDMYVCIYMYIYDRVCEIRYCNVVCHFHKLQKKAH